MAVQTDALDVILRVIGARSFQTAMVESRATVAGLGTEVRRTEAEMTGMAAKGKIAGETMAAVAKVGLVGIGVAAGYAIKNSIEFQKEMTLLQTQAGATAGDVKELHGRVLELARVRPQGPQELAKGLYHFQSVFQNANAAFNALEVSSKGAAVGNADLEETSTALGSALRSIYREQIPNIQQMEKVMGTLNATIGAGNMRMDQLSLALGTAVVPAGINAGLTLEDIGGALAVLTDEGQRADNAATHLRMAFTLMSATSKKAENELAGIGIKANELGTIMHGPNGLVNSLAYVRQQLEKKFPTFGPQLSEIKNPEQALQLAKRFSVISKAFGGARSSATIMLLLNNLDLLGEKTDQVKHKTNRLDAAFKAWGETADAKVKNSLSDLQASLTEFGDDIRDHAVKWIVIFVNKLSWMVKHMDTAIKAFAAWIFAWGLLKFAIMATNAQLSIFNARMLIAAIWDAVIAINGLGDAFIVLGLTIEATPAGWIITAIALIIIAVVMLITHWKWFKGVMSDVWDWVMAHWGAAALIATAIGGPFLAIIVLIATHWKQLKPIFKSVLDWLSPVLHALGDTAKSIFGHIVGYITSMVHGAIAVINFMIRAYNKLPGFMRPTGQITPIGGWGPNEGPNKNIRMPASYNSTIPMFLGPTANFGPPTPLGAMPGGGKAVVHSLRKPRAHTPDPEPVLGNPLDGLENHVHVHLDGKEIFKSVSKHAADKKARK